MGSRNNEDFLSVLAKNFDVLAVPLVALVYPLFPIWSYAKLFATCWLVLPQFNGAAYVYQSFIRPFYWNPRVQTPTAASTIWYIPRKKNIFGKQDGVLAAAEAYIEEHGPEAFERLMSKANREARLRRRHSMKTMTFDDVDYRY